MEKKYCYPDINDKLTLAFIREKEPYQDYWRASERKILDLIKKRIEKHAMPSCPWLLDAGCGTGRLLPEFQKYFSKILAIDPDYTQIEKAKKTTKDYGFDDKVTFKVVSAEQLEWDKESIDVILFSHILQHISTDSVQKILSRFHEILKQNGLLFITTTHSTKKQDYFVKETLSGSKNIEKPINEEEFNSLVNNTQNILPIHFFSVNCITKNLNENGFKLLDFRPYHIISKSKRFAQSIERDEVVNASEQLKAKFGRDMLIVCQKLVE